MKRFVCTFLALVLMLMLVVSASANTIDQKKNELNQVGENIKEAKDDLRQVNQEQSKISLQIEAIENDLAKKERELKAAEAQLTQTLHDLAATEEEILETEAVLEAAQLALEQTRLDLALAIEQLVLQEDRMAERLRTMFIHRSISYLELLLEAKSLNELLNKMEMIRQLVSFDLQILEDMTEHRAHVDAQKLEQEVQEQTILTALDVIEEKKASLEDKERAIRNDRTKITRQKQEIESRRQERKRLLSDLEEEKAAIQNELDEMEHQSKQLEKTIQDLIREQEAQRKRQIYAGGIMAWPVPGYEGRISSPFGARIHPIKRRQEHHTGIDIAGAYIDGKPAVAAADGVVLLSGWLGGYGNTVIIDHGSGITTLYAHGKSRTVNAGDTVKRGDTVLRVGTTGMSTGPHLHFEVRKNGVPTNPMPFLTN